MLGISPLAIIQKIHCPYQHLVEQWVVDIKKFGVNPIVLIVSENYKIDVNTAMPMRGRSIPLTSLYSLEIRNDSVISYLPYYGRAYSIPYGGGNGLNFKAPLKEYNMKLDKKGNSVITFTARNPEDKFDFRVKVYSNGSTSIDVNMQNRQSISFQGELDVKEE